MRQLALLIGLILLFSASAILPSCTGDEYDNMTRPIDEEGATHAKDRGQDQACDQLDLKVADCYDACNCCEEATPLTWWTDPLNKCIFLCDSLLLKIDHVENVSSSNLVNYKECVVGCFSICDKPDKDINCYNECSPYLQQG